MNDPAVTAELAPQGAVRTRVVLYAAQYATVVVQAPPTRTTRL